MVRSRYPCDGYQGSIQFDMPVFCRTTEKNPTPRRNVQSMLCRKSIKVPVSSCRFDKDAGAPWTTDVHSEKRYSAEFLSIIISLSSSSSSTTPLRLSSLLLSRATRSHVHRSPRCRCFSLRFLSLFMGLLCRHSLKHTSNLFFSVLGTV